MWGTVAFDILLVVSFGTFYRRNAMSHASKIQEIRRSRRTRSDSNFGRSAIRAAVILTAEALEPRQLLSSSISGYVWMDLNANSMRDENEGVADLPVTDNYTDQTPPGATGAITVRTDRKGHYVMNGLPWGCHDVSLNTSGTKWAQSFH
jgi:hypothetical protein